ncbi:MAG TPA: hypothetical protein VH054_02240, partial [Polyangiaceae bacterium]|nr:hypothetical protein [Polyangiaceae bacterium]
SLSRDASAGPSTDALFARAAIHGLDLDTARAILQKADAGDAAASLERARLAIYDGDCDKAVTILTDPQVAKLDEDVGLGDIASGCARVTAATSIVEDKAQNIHVRFQDDADQVLMPLMVETITKARDTLTRDFGVDWPKPTRVVVVRDLVALSAMTGLPYKDASTTGTVGIAKWGRVTLLSPRASQHGFAWRDTLAHELTHLAVTRASGDLAPLWLQEGLAKREEIRWRGPGPFDDKPSPESVVAYGMQKHLDLPLDKLGPSIAMLPSADQAMVAFAEVTSFLRYLANEAGTESIKKLLAALHKATPIDKAMIDATGADLKGWDAKWRAHLATLGESPPPALLAAETKEARGMHEHVRLAELLIGRGHDGDAALELDAVNGPLLTDPHVRYLKARALEKTDPAAAKRVLGEPADVFASYAPWWAIHGRMSHDENDFWESISQDPFDIEATCRPENGKDTKAGDPLCEAAKQNGEPDVGKE